MDPHSSWTLMISFDIEADMQNYEEMQKTYQFQLIDDRLHKVLTIQIGIPNDCQIIVRNKYSILKLFINITIHTFPYHHTSPYDF